MDDATRKSLELWLSREDMHDEVIDDVLRQCLARDAERTTPVTPEWLDGAEGKRLGFARVGKTEWRSGSDDIHMPAVYVNLADLSAGYRGLTVFINTQCVGEYGVPTIAQVRAAVFLATGRE